MKTILLAGVFALGVGLAATTATVAAPALPGLDKATNATSLLQEARYCRGSRSCWWRHGHRHCEWRRHCRG